MPNPQQPELRRSGEVPALNPDAVEGELAAHDRPSDNGPVGEIPDEQRPGHHPDHEQDKPDLDAFAARLGVAAEGDEPADAPHLTEVSDELSPARWRSQWKRMLVPAVAAVGIALVLVRRLRR